MSKELISVIVPVYNCEKYLSACLESILSQSYKNFELILIDDGSTDGSLGICKSFEKKDKRIHVCSIKNSGAGGARNRGLELVKGQYIAFIDCDDVVSPDYLECLLEGMKADVDLNCVKYVNFESEVLFSEKQPNSRQISGDQAIEDLLLGKLLAGPVCKLYKRGLIGNLRFEKFSVAEDFYFNYNYLKKCSAISLSDKELYGYRKNSSSLTKSNFKPSRMDGLEALKKIAKSEGYSRASIIRLFMEAYFILEILDRYKQAKEYPAQTSECKSILKKYRKTVLFSGKSPKKQRIIALLSFISPILPVKLINLLAK
ncbi:glycosyltransferase family 2 protein [Candidatus Saccharibacteria bacterium]|nr:glycosyltransferase family 2 protein [Candidatus Saccharibacteria bacterium]